MANINENIFKAKYAINKDETFEMMCDRVAFNDEQARLMKNKSIIPAGRHLTARESDTDKTLFNCYVLSHKDVNRKGIDSREAISNLEMRADNISSRGGGIGVNWSSLRPKDSEIGINEGGSSGSISFMKRFAYGQSVITQGKSRRGALMGSMCIYHPDIEEFIDVKQDLTQLNNMNISIMIDDNFMNAVKKNEKIKLYYPDYKNNKELYNEEWDGNLFETKLPCKIYKEINARELWRKITTNAWKTGEPGILFYSTINKLSNYVSVEKIMSCNPCAEEPLLFDMACVLASINLSEHIYNDFGAMQIDYNKLRHSVKHLVDYLDETIDVEKYSDEAIKEKSFKYRQIGVGVLGFADLLIKLGIDYRAKKAIEIANDIGKFILNEAYYRSSARAKKYGKAPIWEDNKPNNHYISMCSKETQEHIEKYGLRNSAILSIAPTGSIAMLLKVNGGIEPYFAFRYERDDVLGKRVVEEEIAKKAPNKDVLITAQEVSPEQHVRMQAIWQKYTDASISKTINLPSTATIEDVENAYMLAWELGCKGTTVYRDGCRAGVLNHIKDDVDKDIANIRNIFKEYGNKVIPVGIKPPKSSYMKKKKIKTDKGKKFYFMTGYLEETFDTPFELFITTNCHEKNDVVESLIDKMRNLLINKGVNKEIVETLKEKAKHSAQNNIDRIARLISMALRHNVKIVDIVNVLDEYTESISSLIYHIKKHLESLISDNTIVESEKCPECGSDIIYVSGCKQCVNTESCGWSKC